MDVENIEIDHIGGYATKNNAESEAYYANLRAYKATAWNYKDLYKRQVQQWLADEEHVDENSEALRELWKQAGEQKVPDGMQQSIQRMRQNLSLIHI